VSMNTASTDLASRLQQLLRERDEHAGALARIERALAQVGAALQVPAGSGANGRRRGRPPGPAKALGAPRGRRRRRNFAVTGDELILSMVGQRGGATTQEVKARWKSEGRGGTADNALSKLVRERKLRRIALEDRRGSRYVLP